jgi:ABC-type cobalamin/Fe3+-siderophores transport system ATPase subunit
MVIKEFNIRNTRSIKIAQCDNVPKLMIIAGPNGAGKSTLLYQLKTNRPGRILYIGPHRHTRRQSVRYRSLISRELSLEDILTQNSVEQRIDEMQVYQRSREPWDSDESLNYLKYGLCQLEIDRKEAIASIYDQKGEIPKGQLPDIWEPLKEFSKNLLPHLSFERIDLTNRDNIRCLWKVHSKDTVIDLDELSSGEKSIVQIFYPVIEQRIKNILKTIKGEEVNPKESICLLVDEPELHLHPNLQVKALDYLRLIAYERNIQVIITTHSPTIVENASSDELFILRPYELLQEGENQLKQIADDDDKLNFLRNIFGSTSNITAMQAVVIVEGVRQKKGVSTVSDRKLYRVLHSKFDKVTLIPGGGKSECLKLKEILETELSTFSSKLKVVALLDRDLGISEGNGVSLLPVSMIENFLIDPTSIWDSIQSVIEQTKLSSIEALEKEIDELLDHLEDLEVERRTLNKLGYFNFRPERPIDSIAEQIKKFKATIDSELSPDKIEEAKKLSIDEVKTLKQEKKRREHFHGKLFIEEFYKRNLHSSGLSKNVFKFETARHSNKRKSVKTFFDNFFDPILKDLE